MLDAVQYRAGECFGQESVSGRRDNCCFRASRPCSVLSDTLTSASEITKRQHFCYRSHIGNIALNFINVIFMEINFFKRTVWSMIEQV